MLSLDNMLGTPEQLIKSKRLAGWCRIREQEVIKVVDGFSAGQLTEREISLLSRPSRLH
jgi:hypothetical protein